MSSDQPQFHPLATGPFTESQAWALRAFGGLIWLINPAIIVFDLPIPIIATVPITGLAGVLIFLPAFAELFGDVD